MAQYWAQKAASKIVDHIKNGTDAHGPDGNLDVGLIAEEIQRCYDVHSRPVLGAATSYTPEESKVSEVLSGS